MDKVGPAPGSMDIPVDDVALCVCVPARNEAGRLPILLDALADQCWPAIVPVCIAINNTTDDSLQVIESARKRHSDRLEVRVEQADFSAEHAHAGSARRLAMDAGLALLARSDNAILVSTDADTRPPRDWLAANVAAFAKGADVVGGRLDIDPAEPLSAPVRRLRDAWDHYWSAVRAIEEEIDPLPWDPAPRHGDHTGASLAIRADVYRLCGGVPLVPTGEDRALVSAAQALGARLVHPESVYTHVSPRLQGRAEGGMATAMQDLRDAAQSRAVQMAPSFEHWRIRAEWRRDLRLRPGGHALIARHEPLLPPMPCDMPIEVGP